MTHAYQVAGITCEGCVSKVKYLLEKIPGVQEASVGLDGRVSVKMSHHVTTAVLQEALKDHPKYQLKEPDASTSKTISVDKEAKQGFWHTYRPILIIFAYILGATLLMEAMATEFELMRWMRYFMAGFFLVFSFFKMLDVPAFAASYATYDILAKRWPGWGYIYPFVELALGVLFLIDYNPLITNGITLGVMGLSTVGVIRSLLAKRRIQCACLGAVFNLPMSYVTVVEDTMMVAMSGLMLLMYV